MRLELLPLDPASYRPHPLHDDRRIWRETNCYVDLWIEVLHALGLDPVPAGAVALASDFEGDQWTFLKYAAEDLRVLYGIEVAELGVWRPVASHVVEYLQRGSLLTVEVDAWSLPDSGGVSYHRDHVKTTIVPQMVDVDERRLGYFHNAGYHELGGDDYEAILGGSGRDVPPLPPYVELVRVGGGRPRDPGELAIIARSLARSYLARGPVTNPVERFGRRLEEDLPSLRAGGLDTFHRYAFATCRQCGAAAEIASSFVRWLDAACGMEAAAPGPAEALEELASGAKTLEFVLARVAAGRVADVGAIVALMAAAWERAVPALRERFGA